MNPFKRTAAEQTDDVDFRRASGDCVCKWCGQKYYDHPAGGPPGFDGHQFLNVLCNGDLVKL
jgi:hypothetical protein